MKELISLPQANTLMLAVLFAAPLMGLLIGVRIKSIRAGLTWGLVIGIGNFALWRVYNAITDRLGLDTVKNLLTNIGLFIVVGLVAGIVLGLMARRKQSNNTITV